MRHDAGPTTGKMRPLIAAAAVVMIAIVAAGCVNLTPIRAVRQVDLNPLAGQANLRIDPTDSSAVFVNEGLRIRVHHLDDVTLNKETPGPENPYTYLDAVDYDQGHVPVRFTVFQVTVNNPTFDKVLLRPEKASLVTDRGKVMQPYLLTRADALGSLKNFETYWLSRGVQSGNQQKLYLERMSLLRGSVYHRDSFVFKGNSYTGKLVFDPLPEGTGEATLYIEDFVLEFGIYDIPRTELDLQFPFSVESDVVEPAL